MTAVNLYSTKRFDYSFAFALQGAAHTRTKISDCAIRRINKRFQLVFATEPQKFAQSKMATGRNQVNGDALTSPRKKPRTDVMSKVTVVLGAQWGDEGKGKVVDMLATHSEIVCRCQVRIFCLTCAFYTISFTSCCHLT